MHRDIKLKQFLDIRLDDHISIHPELMIWSPIHHYWIFIKGPWESSFSKKELKFLLKQPISFIDLRNDTPQTIAVYLKDYGKQKNKKLRTRLGKK